MMFTRLGKFVRLSSRKLLVAIALTPLMGFSLGSYVALEKPEKPEAAVAAADVQRGRLLYETYCIACHTTQAHWRDKHIVASWADLLYQVTRMQKNAGQDWSSTEISDVATYLNELFYKMPCPSPGCGEPQASTNARTALARAR
jgi:mono/diheme cytochrome c family protein